MPKWQGPRDTNLMKDDKLDRARHRARKLHSKEIPYSRPPTDLYLQNFDSIFRKKEEFDGSQEETT